MAYQMISYYIMLYHYITAREEVANVVIELLSTFPDHMNALFPLLLSNTTSQVRLIILRRVDTITLTEEQVQTIVLEKQVEPLEWRVREEIARHIDCFLRDVKKGELQEKVLELVRKDLMMRMNIDG